MIKFKSLKLATGSRIAGLKSSQGAFAAGAMLTALSTAMPAAAQVATASDAQGEYARGRIIVMPRAGLAQAELARAVGVHGGKPTKVGQSNLYIVELPVNASEKAVVNLLANNPHFKFAELDRRGHVAFANNDPYLGSEWHTTMIGAPAAWDAGQGSGVTIAVLDTGVDSTHPDLAKSIVPGWNFVDNNSNSSDVMGHGTKSAGAAAATSNNALGVSGVAGQAKIMPIRVTAADGTFFYSAVAQGLTYAADHGARVANMSLYGAASSSSIRSAAQYMKDKGGLVITSAGNNSKDEGWAATTTMIPVSATDSSDAMAAWSSYGGFVAMSAPGVGIWTTTVGGGYGAVSGTSFASPVTAGVVALMMAANPKLSSAEIEKILFATAVDRGANGRDPYYGYGRVNAAAAVLAALAATTTVDLQAPAAFISAPLGGTTVSGLVPVNVSATDNVGVTKVELRVNGSTVATDTAAPYAFSWDSTRVANGTANVVAYAFDAAGNSAPSAAVAVSVSNGGAIVGPADTTPPVVNIVNPTGGTQITGMVSVTVNASDNAGSGGITQTLLIDGHQVATAIGPNLSYKWNARKLSSGTHTIEVVAKDASGNRSSKTVQVNK